MQDLKKKSTVKTFHKGQKHFDNKENNENHEYY